MTSEGARHRAARGLSDTDAATQEAGAKVVELCGGALTARLTRRRVRRAAPLTNLLRYSLPPPICKTLFSIEKS
jgi:hypothetical protein